MLSQHFISRVVLVKAAVARDICVVNDDELKQSLDYFLDWLTTWPINHQ